MNSLPRSTGILDKSPTPNCEISRVVAVHWVRCRPLPVDVINTGRQKGMRGNSRCSSSCLSSRINRFTRALTPSSSKELKLLGTVCMAPFPQDTCPRNRYRNAKRVTTSQMNSSSRTVTLPTNLAMASLRQLACPGGIATEQIRSCRKPRLCGLSLRERRLLSRSEKRHRFSCVP